jgi:hypothetical protein
MPETLTIDRSVLDARKPRAGPINWVDRIAGIETSEDAPPPDIFALLEQGRANA